MSQKTFSIRLFGIMVFSILFIATLSYADQYYDQYPGNGFFPRFEIISYSKGVANASIHHDNTLDASFICPVSFNVRDGSVYFIKSIGIRYKDNTSNGQIHVLLRRQNLYTGAVHEVASWDSGDLFASDSDQTASHGTTAGYKLVDTKKFVYWICAYFFMGGDVSPGSNLVLHQVRIHYGT